jgi:hypothetical protein
MTETSPTDHPFDATPSEYRADDSPEREVN